MGNTIKLTASDGHEFDAYRANAEGTAKAGLVVVQEIFGVNIHIREVCDSFAAEGYTAIAPALFDRAERGVEIGYEPDDLARGREIRGQVTWDDAVLDVETAAKELASLPKVGVVGYCWGGSMAWLGACRLGFNCAVGYYGGQIIGFVEEKPSCATMLHFGETDASIPLDDVEVIRATHPGVPIHIYEGAGHGFSCDHRGSYHAESAATARERTLAFMADHLG